MRLSLSPSQWSKLLLFLACMVLLLTGFPVSSEAQSHADRGAARRLMAEMSEEETESADPSEGDSDFRSSNFENADFDAGMEDLDYDFRKSRSKEEDAPKKIRNSSSRSSKSGSAAKRTSRMNEEEEEEWNETETEEDQDLKSGSSSKKRRSGTSSRTGSSEKKKKSSADTKKRTGSSRSEKSGRSSKTKGKRNVQKEEVPEDTRTPEEKERDRMAYFRETGIWRWPELTETQIETEIEKQKKYLEEIKAKFPRTVYYESEHFFYLTDAPQPIAMECMKYLEAMFARLCEMFEFPKGSRVWTGKCIVCAFAFQQDFLRFEQEFFGATANKFTGASGLAHMSSDGNVLISLFYGNISTMAERWRFIGVLVHESTHGFMHRYRARQSLPLWLEEGIADTMPAVIVPADRQAGLKQRSGLNQMRQTGSVGGLMQSAGPLEAWQYGIASGLVQFMLKQNPHGFKEFLDSIKDGKDWVEALKETYRCTPEELLFHFGRANRIPRLTF
ncbi:MAG: hypothetical protein J6A23_08590 [Thermoguttaceae bacterium]|nr:hypothetical protein [Thermoguttaceae bacterium]